MLRKSNLLIVLFLALIVSQPIMGRYYSSSVGRWLSVDPMANLAHGWSPYNYAFNNPLKHTDPDGRFPWGAVIGGGVELAGQIASDMIVNDVSFGAAFGNVDWADVGTAAAVGLVTGGLSSLKTVGTIGKVGINIAGNIAEGAIKANTGTKTNEYGAEDAITDVAVGGLSAIGGQIGKEIAQGAETKTLKGLKKSLKRLNNIAGDGKKRVAQTNRAVAKADEVKNYGSGLIAQTLNQTTTTTTKEIYEETKGH